MYPRQARLTGMSGREQTDPATATMPGRAVYDYTSRLNADGLRCARVGVLYGDLMQKPVISPALHHAPAAYTQRRAHETVRGDVVRPLLERDKQVAVYACNECSSA
ncbi:hypothetical protein OEZ83_26435, partial [Leclercia adecarboxylata]|uniref:hypothetical protein n=1 Tax=Leclercia adecarboxylata TaxID=83655 RepID=UPI00234CE6D0